MALLFMDGFDHYATADLAKKWDTAGGSVSVGAVGANSSNGVRFISDGNGHDLIKNLASTVSTIIVGASILAPASSNWDATWGFIELRDGTTTQVRIYRASDGTLTALRGSTSLGSSSAGALPAGERAYVEVKALISDTVGTVEVRVNGKVVINLTGQDTQASANAYVDRVKFSGAGNSGNTDMDDIYICDTSGSSNNDFLGPVRISTIRPTAEGANSAWTPSSGTDNALMVDETSQDGDTTYNSTGTATSRDTYVMQDISALGGTVYGVAVNVVARKEGDTVRKIKATIKSGATYALGAEETLSTAYDIFQAVHNTNPDTSTAWTETTVNAIEAGVDLTV